MVAPLQRIALKLQYMGTQFFGWQRQARNRSVQAVLEDAIAARAGHEVVIHGAGRTDTGVHAAGQVAHFDTTSPIPWPQWALVLNNCLPPDVAVLASVEVPQAWHARFSASWRRYRYLILNQDIRDVFWTPVCWHHRLPLDVAVMSKALASLVGHHDLEAFRLSGSKRPHSWVRVEETICRQEGNLIWIEVQASGFLYRMMRLLVGTLAFVGRGELSAEEFAQLWQNQELMGTRFRYTAPPQGLCLTDVGYPEDPFARFAWIRGSPLPTALALSRPHC